MCESVIKSKGSDSNVLIVTHGGFFKYYHNTLMAEIYPMEFPKDTKLLAYVPNTCINKYDVHFDPNTGKPTKFVCSVYNNTDHYKLIDQ